jgi:hypothetical protein
MPTTAFATITAFSQVNFGKYDETFRTQIIIFVAEIIAFRKSGRIIVGHGAKLCI